MSEIGNQQSAIGNPASPLRCPTCGQLGDAAEARLVTCRTCERENSTACCQPGGEGEPCWECAEIEEELPPAEHGRCAHCTRALAPSTGRRPREYCDGSCRAAAAYRRRLAREEVPA